ncbi:hypothetical protein H6P81_017415 [Aristolochia fimbriata]|uniref:Uncharacterized protein n=1 Tax=Aristolochia fimbriata TaxID=158543 RepID=A0AAV7DZH1_ARIFI|nr:hypothetical protein H6P81_017415 [Aristolochia fimbriata]
MEKMRAGSLRNRQLLLLRSFKFFKANGATLPLSNLTQLLQLHIRRNYYFHRRRRRRYYVAYSMRNENLHVDGGVEPVVPPQVGFVRFARDELAESAEEPIMGDGADPEVVLVGGSRDGGRPSSPLSSAFPLSQLFSTLAVPLETFGKSTPMLS